MVNANMQRQPRLQGQRGAAVFIVVMVLTLLTAVGIFAVRSASMADVAAGFDREGAQASLVAQYGILSTAALIGTPGIAATMVAKMEGRDVAYIPPVCESNAYPLSPLPPPSPVPASKPSCYKYTSLPTDSIALSFLGSSNETIFAPSNAPSPGYGTSTSSLNANETTDAAFIVELTDAWNTGMPVPGYEITQMVFHHIALTSIAQVRPVAACASGTLTTPNAAQTAVRAMISVGAPP